MGALEIRSLMKELVDSRKMTLKQFNDAFLREGEMPIEMMRAALTGQALTRTYNASWKFYGEVEPAKP
jgi:folate-dependent tRNA-U54 methylase TrmFO/GidA